MIDEEIKERYSAYDWSGVDFAEKPPWIDDVVDGFLFAMGDLPGKRILDLGCGSATLGVELAERGYDVVGLDLHVEPARKRARARGASVQLIEQDMSEMTFSEDFDAVINWDVSGIGLFPTDEENIEVVRRVSDALVDGGKFFLETYHLPYIQNHPGRVEGLVYSSETNRCSTTVCRTMPDGTERTWDISVRYFTGEEWRGILERVGLEFIGAWDALSIRRKELIRPTPKNRMLAVLGCKKQDRTRPRTMPYT
jgi:SAM-dependent methyltransferase